MSKIKCIIEMNEEDFKSIEYSTLLYHLHATPITESDDTISRDMAIKAVDAHTNEDGTLDDDISIILEDLPPVLPKREQGEWINIQHGILNNWAMCSKCKERTIMPCEFHYKICPKCGAEMR